jgi:hypothetical protein
LVLWTCGWFSATAGGGEGARFPALAPTKTARKRGRDRGKLAAIVLCFDVGCVALAHSNSSPLSLAERRRRRRRRLRRDDGTLFLKSDDAKIKHDDGLPLLLLGRLLVADDRLWSWRCMPTTTMDGRSLHSVASTLLVTDLGTQRTPTTDRRTLQHSTVERKSA